MQEDKQDTDGADVLDEEEIDVEQSSVAERAPVGKLIFHNLVGCEPTDKDTSEEAHDGQEHLSCHKIEEIEDGLLKQHILFAYTQR